MPWREEMTRIRSATTADMGDMFRVRTSVRENLLTESEMAALGITPRSLTELMAQGKLAAWCVERDGVVVGFSMAKRDEREVFALFLLPEFEGRGIGRHLLDAAVSWLGAISPDPVRLSTGQGTRAHGFYLGRGWREVESKPDTGDVVLELVPSKSTADRESGG